MGVPGSLGEVSGGCGVSWGVQRASEEEPLQFGFSSCPYERTRAHWKMKTQEVNELH